MGKKKQHAAWKEAAAALVLTGMQKTAAESDDAKAIDLLVSIGAAMNLWRKQTEQREAILGHLKAMVEDAAKCPACMNARADNTVAALRYLRSIGALPPAASLGAFVHVVEHPASDRAKTKKKTRKRG